MLYFSSEGRAQYARLLTELSVSRELIWIANEHPLLVTPTGFGAPLEVTTDTGGLPLVMSHFSAGGRDDRVLAIIGPHGRWLEWLD